MDNASDDNGSVEMELSDDELELVEQPTGSKRKMDDRIEDTAVAKRPKTDGSDQASIHQLPDAVMQHIFMSLSPAMLFRCTRVCRRFAIILTQISGEQVRSTKKRFDRHNPEPAAQLVDSEVVWSHSRRHTYPFLPRPLNHLSERQMLCLLTQTICQRCEKTFPRLQAGYGLEGGPGSAGLSTVWQFRVTLCGTCLLHLTITDVELLQERSALPAGALRRGLAYAFMTKDLRIVSDGTAYANLGVGITKIFYRLDLDALKESYAEVQALGAGAAEEWVKGLDAVGKGAMIDATRWSRWEALLPSGTNFAAHLRELDTSTSAAHVEEQPRPARPTTALTATQHLTVAPPPAPLHFQNPLVPTPRAHLPVRPPRDPLEVQEILRRRIEDIQHRCMQLVPPIEPEVLKYIPAYTAATQITMPMNDTAWEQLRPRIEQGRETAEELHYQKSQQEAILRAAIPSHPYDDMLAADKAATLLWEQERTPLRKQLGSIADNLINRKWLRASLDQYSAPILAAEVLDLTYQQYYADSEARGVTATTPLVLDDLRWVYESKIKALAEAHCRELFACSDCFANDTCRWFAFEGLIQHYGAKHTSDFSKGNIVVHWQTALWPEDPPFVTDLSKIDQNLFPRRNSYDPHQFDNRPSSRGRGHSPSSRPGSRGGRHQPNSRNGNTEHMDPFMHSQRGQTSIPSNMPVFGHGPSAPTQGSASESDPVAKLSVDVSEAWNVMAGVNGLTDSIRVQTVLQVAKARYEQREHSYLPIETMTKVLATSSEVAELKLTNKLACRFCNPTLEKTSMPYYERLAKKAMYALPGLLNHFKLSHMSELRYNPGLWSNLVDLPDKDQVQALLKTPGMNDKKLALVAQAFPGVFPVPLPHIGTVPAPEPDSGLASRLVQRSLGTTKGKKKKGREDDAADASKAGEYDPRNPSLPAKSAAPSKPEKKTNTPLDLSKFDTDSFRPPSSSKPAGVTGAPTEGPFAISADTLAAISRLQSGKTAVAPETHAAIDTLRSYAPSVAQQAPPERLPSPYAERVSVPAPSQPAVVPDISAIIATLSQQRAPAVPDVRTPALQSSFGYHATGPAERATTYRQGHESFATPAPYQSYGAWQPAPPAQPQYYPRPSQPVRDSFGGQDLLAALNQNRAASRQHDSAYYAGTPSAQYTRETPSYQEARPQYNYPQAPAPFQYAQQAAYPPQYGHQSQDPQGEQPVMLTEVYQPDGSKYLLDQFGRRFYQANDQ